MNCSSLIFYFTDLPKDVVNILTKDLEDKYDSECEPSLLHGAVNYNDLRNSYNTWVPDYHWVTGFIWHYINKANQSNFQYDIKNIDNNSLQYTRYGIGEKYKWHVDHGLYDLQQKESLRSDNVTSHVTNEVQRKLSFSMQLSGPDDYTGGNFQLLDDNGELMVAPRQLGSLIIFDSRLKHRVCPVKTGTRRSIVGWVMGPRFK